MTAMGPRHRAGPETVIRPRRGFAIARIATGLVSAIAIAATGAGWWAAHHTLGGITVSQALGADDPRSTGAAINILLIGLDSRKDQQGNDLPQAILNQLHAGDSDAGGYNTNTLILVHLSADNKVTAFSIPRDDYVAVRGIPGYSHIKIKEAYGLAKADAQQKLTDRGVTDQQSLETHGREAGRAATLRAVRDLTGQPIDYFAEINLGGFYDLAAALGGVQVCLNHPVYDDYSGADFPAGVQTLNAAQTLAFVRQRHGLDNGDLDRTHRQQAFLVSVMQKLQSSGTFTDLSKLNALISTAQKDIVLSTGWNDQLFRRVGDISGSDMEYLTLPVLRYDTVDGEDVNIVDPSAIRGEVATAFNGDTSALRTASQRAPASVVDVVNAGSTTGLARDVSLQLTHRGYAIGQTRNSMAGEATSTAIDYGTGAETDASDIASLLGVSATPQPDSAVAPGHVRVTLGEGYVEPTTGYASNETSSGAANEITPNSAGNDTTSVSPTPDQGRPVDGGKIPCVN
ncbi:MAG: LCP family protein [Mycobacteriaceae bacterium]|nr:LCP family protein [Mycobacteriaceae bacterium]